MRRVALAMFWTVAGLALAFATFALAPALAEDVNDKFLHAAVFALLGRATWWIGALLGLLHVAVALTVILPLLPGVHPRMASTRAGPGTAAVLEPPGLLGLNYGIQTPAVAVVAHLVYGAMLGLLLRAL